MFLTKYIVLDGTYPHDRIRIEYTQSELDAFGGEAFIYNPLQLWIIDAQTARRLHLISVTGNEPIVSHLAAARNDGQSLPLGVMESELIELIRKSSQQPSSATTGASDPATPTPAPEARVAALAQNEGKYDAVARIRVRSHTEVDVPVRTTDWPAKQDAVPSRNKWQRSNVEVLERYHGVLPATFDTVNPFFQTNPHLSLQVGQEYVVFVYQRWLPLGEHLEDERRIHYNQEQLNAVGGEGYAYFAENTWIIDGDDVLLVPAAHIIYGDARAGTHLEAARKTGESVPLTTLENYIRSATADTGEK